MTVQEVVPGVWRAGTRYVNWYLVDAGADGVTVVDGGLPAYRRQLAPALRALGRSPADLRAVVLTHGHVDHTGLAAEAAALGIPVHLHADDERLAADPRTNVTQRPLRSYLHYPATAAFVLHAVRNGAARPAPMPSTSPLADGQTLDVPGSPVVAHTPGHTDGSCVLHFREHGVALVGDLLCTTNPFSGRREPPQLQTRGSNRDSDRAMASLDDLVARVDAPVVLPGHGDPWRDGVEAAVDSARRTGCR